MDQYRINHYSVEIRSARRRARLLNTCLALAVVVASIANVLQLG